VRRNWASLEAGQEIYSDVSPRSEAEASAGDSECYNSLAFSLQAAGVKPAPTLLETMRHFSCS